ncbi:MAG: hypothetical protein AAGC86_11480 [Pseudomonadota bacterium]
MQFRPRLTVPSALCAALTCLQPAPSAAQSFDCTKAGNETEKTICSDRMLGALDMGMSDAYSSAVQTARGLGGGDEDTLHRTQRAWVQNRNRCGADISCLAASYTTRLEQLNSDFSLWNSWTGTYDGPFGENQFTISQSDPPNYDVNFIGGSENYTCGPVTGSGVPKDGRLVVTSDGADSMVLQAAGPGLFLPDNRVNDALISDWCGMRAPQLVGAYFGPSDGTQ